ncbi:hypothetical protein CRYUN_Cryun11dG0061300 [Craigia yunnanensis]
MGIFEPYRAIGYITSRVPFSVQRLGTKTSLTVTVGKAFQIYNCSKLNSVLIGPQLPKKIRALASYRDFTFAAYGTDIAVFKRAHQVANWSRHNAKVNLLLLFGDHILSVDVDGNVFIWAFKGIEDNLAPIGHIKLDAKCTPACIMHPDTYLNKAAVGGEVIEPGQHMPDSSSVELYFLLLEFGTKNGQPLLASGGSSGVISIWNFEKKRLQSVIREAHESSITSLHFFANEPVLMSSSADNSIKMWIFDTSDGDPCLLRFGSGHSAPPLCIRFYANGRHILSAGQDRAFRLFSVIQEEELKLKPVIAFDCAEIRERDWCNVVTCHMDTEQAYVWRLQNFVLSEHILRPCPENPTPVKACTISACGNFAVLGTAGGWIERFNLQSGISRGYHRDIKVWDFKGRELKSRWEIGFAVVKIVYNRLNGLLATVTDDLLIHLYDVVALRTVRKFEGHTDRITDLCFSEDGKWLLSSSMDGSLRIWDVDLARQIDAIHVDVSITALSLSPNMDVLATTHVDQNGVYLWVNRSIFSGTSNVDSFASVKEIVNVKLPSISSLDGSQTEDSAEPVVDNSVSKDASVSATFIKQIPELVTFSLLPKSQWQSLFNLDIIELIYVCLTYCSFGITDYIKSLSSLALDMELRMLQIIIDDENLQELDRKPEMISIELFLDYFVYEISYRNNFEFVQAVIRLFLKASFESQLAYVSTNILARFLMLLQEDLCWLFFDVLSIISGQIHGETIRCHSKLQDKAKKLLEIQSDIWQKIDTLFQRTRCMVTFLSNSQF